MNDNINKMLSDINVKSKTTIFEKELKLLGEYAKNNVEVIYEEIYRSIINQYKNHPNKSGEFSYYSTAIIISSSANANKDNFNNITYCSNLNDLIREYNYEHKDKINYFIYPSFFLYDVYFNITNLKELLINDGFYVKEIKKELLINDSYFVKEIENSYLSIAIQVDKFREMINNAKQKSL